MQFYLIWWIYQSRPVKDNRYIMVMQDHLTKFVWLRPLKSKRAAEVAYKILKIFREVGPPSILHSDQGREFVNAMIEELKVSLYDVWFVSLSISFVLLRRVYTIPHVMSRVLPHVLTHVGSNLIPCSDCTPRSHLNPTCALTCANTWFWYSTWLLMLYLSAKV